MSNMKPDDIRAQIASYQQGLNAIKAKQQKAAPSPEAPRHVGMKA